MNSGNSFDISAFEAIDFPASSIIYSAMACLLLIAIPLAFWLIWRGKHKSQTNFRYFLIGALGFLISARVLELGVHLVCIVYDNPVSRFINSSHLAYVLYGIIMAGVFEECGRYIVLRFIMKKDKTPENAVMYGIGHGGIEVLTVSLPVYVLYLIISVLFSNFGTAQAMTLLNISEAAAPSALPTVQSAATFGYTDCALCVIERLLCMLVHIGLTVVVYYGVIQAKKKYLGYAILLHMAVDILPAMYQRGLVYVWLCELWIFIWASIITILAVKLYKRSAEAV